MFRPPQPVGMIARIELGDAAARPGQLAQARLPRQLVTLAPRHAQQAAHPFDHHRPRLVDRGRDQRDPHRPAPSQAINPFRSGPSFPKAAPGHHQPHPPAFGARRDLPLGRPRLERRVDQQNRLRRAFRDPLALLVRRHLGQQPHGVLRDVDPHRGGTSTVPPRLRRPHSISANRSTACLVSTACSASSSASRSRKRSSRAMIRSHASW